MFTEDDWHEVDNHLSLLYKGEEFCFVCEGVGRGPLLWEPQYGNSFFVRLRFEPDCDEGEIILSWGWEHSTLHDAIVWKKSNRFEPFDQPDTEGGGPRVIAVHKSQLIHSVKREVRRVAAFADPAFKRPLEFAELRAAFAKVVSDWEEFLAQTDIEPHNLESPHSKPELSEPPELQECILAHGINRARLHKDELGWRIDVEKQFDAPYEIWRFVETTDVQHSDGTHVHTREMTGCVVGACLAALMTSALIPGLFARTGRAFLAARDAKPRVARGGAAPEIIYEVKISGADRVTGPAGR